MRILKLTALMLGLWWSAYAQTVTVSTAITATAGTLSCAFVSDPGSPTDTVNLNCKVGATDVLAVPAKLLAVGDAFTWQYKSGNNNVTGIFTRAASNIGYQVSAQVGTGTPVTRTGTF